MPRALRYKWLQFAVTNRSAVAAPTTIISTKGTDRLTVSVMLWALILVKVNRSAATWWERFTMQSNQYYPQTTNYFDSPTGDTGREETIWEKVQGWFTGWCCTCCADDDTYS
jgi:hypothetical protein